MKLEAELLFRFLAAHLSPALEAQYNRRDQCILATRAAVDICAYYGVEARPVCVQAIVTNKQWQDAMEMDDVPPEELKRLGAYSIGVGYGNNPGEALKIAAGTVLMGENRWVGHLIAVAGDVFGDFAIRQAERPQHGIITGTGIVGTYLDTDSWIVGDDRSGTCIFYQRFQSTSYRAAPDWWDLKNRRKVVGALIRQAKEELCPN